MAKQFSMKHTKRQPNGSIKYWRRVPKHLQATLGKQQISKALGKTDSEALANYPAVHRHFERLFSEPSAATDTVQAMETRDRIESLFLEHKLSLRSAGSTDAERFAREEEADRILNRYPLDPETGYPDPDDLTFADASMVAALLQGTQAIQVQHTITSVFGLYLAEKRGPDHKKHKKFADRVLQIQNALIKVVGYDAPVSDLTRSHARALRDLLKKGPGRNDPNKGATHGTIKRKLGIAKAVINYAILELDLNVKNPFEKIDLGKPTDNAVDRRLPLPKPLIGQMYEELSNNQTLLDIWTLLHHTGAQNAEVLGLKKDDLNLSHAIPHFEIKPDGLRTVKERSRIRTVPLVGLALEVAQRLHDQTNTGNYLFPDYGPTEKHDNFSNACMARLKRHRTNDKHVIYGLRHHMKDCLREAYVSERVQNSLLGHSNERSSSEHYGSAVTLAEKQEALLSVKLF